MFNLSTFLDGSQVTVGVAFLAGFVTFFASCLLPLVPTYLAYLSGVSLTTETATKQRWLVVRHAVLFVSGFVTTFFALGVFSYHLASQIAPYKPVIEKIAGLFFITLGLFMLGVFQHRWFIQERRFDLHRMFNQHRFLHAVIMGVAFGFGWTPCIGPVLAVILYWSAQQATVWQGAGLLLVFGLGLGLPFLLVAIGFEHLIPLLKKYTKVSLYINRFAAGVIIIAGALLLTGQFQSMSAFFLQLFNIHLLTL